MITKIKTIWICHSCGKRAVIKRTIQCPVENIIPPRPEGWAIGLSGECYCLECRTN